MPSNMPVIKLNPIKKTSAEKKLALSETVIKNFSIHEKSCYKLRKSNNIPFKMPSAEKQLAPPETQASKVNISQKVRPFCGIHIQCINVIKKTPLVDVFLKTKSREVRGPCCS